MSPAGTTESDRDIGLALARIARKQEEKQFLDARQRLLIGRILADIGRNLAVESGHRLQYRIPMRIAQKAHVEQQIRVARHAPCKAERHYGEGRRLRSRFAKA